MPRLIQPRGAAALLLSALTYASFGILIRQMALMFGTNAQGAVRLSLATLFLGAFLIVYRRPIKLPPRAAARAIFLGLTFSATVVLFTTSVTATKFVNTVALTYAGSIITSLIIGTLVFGEKFTRTKLIAIVLALIGLAMYSGELAALSLGVVTGLLAGLTDGLGNSTRKTLRGFDPNSIVLYSFVVGSIAIWTVTALSGEAVIRTVSFWPIVATLVFAGLLIGLNKLLLYGFQHFDVNVGTVIMATELFFAGLIGVLIFREIPAANELIGSSVIFLASIVSAVELD